MEYAAQKVPEHAGMEACTELLEWLWDTGISAVAGDAISWEVSERSATSICVHQSVRDGTLEADFVAPRTRYRNAVIDHVLRYPVCLASRNGILKCKYHWGLKAH